MLGMAGTSGAVISLIRQDVELQDHTKNTPSHLLLTAFNLWYIIIQKYKVFDVVYIRRPAKGQKSLQKNSTDGIF